MDKCKRKCELVERHRLSKKWNEAGKRRIKSREKQPSQNQCIHKKDITTLNLNATAYFSCILKCVWSDLSFSFSTWLDRSLWRLYVSFCILTHTHTNRIERGFKFYLLYKKGKVGPLFSVRIFNFTIIFTHQSHNKCLKLQLTSNEFIQNIKIFVCTLLNDEVMMIKC